APTTPVYAVSSTNPHLSTGDSGVVRMSTATNSSAAAVNTNHSRITPSNIETSPHPTRPRSFHYNILPESQRKLAQIAPGRGRWAGSPNVVGHEFSLLPRCFWPAWLGIATRPPGRRVSGRSRRPPPRPPP